MASVQLKQINKTFGRTEIIRSIDLSIADGEFVVFVGPSGCGKSTLLRLIAGLEEATAGELEIDGQCVNDLSPKERGVGMVFQSYALYPHMTVYENIAFGLKLDKASKQSVHQWVTQTAATLQLEDLLDRKPKELSGGQRQRVAIGRAMAREPSILLFDEPLSNLDASLRVQMRTEIAKLHDRLQSTMIYVTHDQVEAMTLADKIVVLNGGDIEQVGTPYALYETPASLFVACFIGSPKMNLLRGRLEAARQGTSQLMIDGVGLVEAAADCQGLEAGSSLTLGIRPEHLAIRPPQGQEPSLEVINVEYLGNESFVYVESPDRSDLLVVRVAAPASVRIGDRVVLVIDPQLAHLFEPSGRALPRTHAEPALEAASV